MSKTKKPPLGAPPFFTLHFSEIQISLDSLPSDKLLLGKFLILFK